MTNSNASTSSSKRYSEYCREHEEEYGWQLKEEAAAAFSTLPLKLGALVMIASSIVTFLDASSRGNPNAIYTLFAYTIPIALTVGYPIITLVFAKIEKYSPHVFDFYLFTVLVSYCVILKIVFAWDYSGEELEAMYQVLNGQPNFVLIICTAFAFHARYSLTLVRNVVLWLSLH